MNRQGGLKTSRLTTLVNISEAINNLWRVRLHFRLFYLARFSLFRRRRKSALKWHSHTSFNPIIAFTAAYDGCFCQSLILSQKQKSFERKTKKVFTLDQFVFFKAPSINYVISHRSDPRRVLFREKVKAKM